MPTRTLQRLRPALLLPAIAGLGAVLVLLLALLPRLLRQGAAEHLADTVPLVATALGAPIDSGDPGALQRTVSALAAGTALRITVLASDGSVLADSAVAADRLASLQNHGDRPEVRAALAGGRGHDVRPSASTGEEHLYVAAMIRGPEGRPVVLRLARPLTSLRRVDRFLGTSLGLALAAALGAVGALSWWLERRFLQPLAQVITGADRLAAGDFEHHLIEPREAEIASLARALNRLAERVREQLAALEAERNHFQSILASMSEGVLVTDRQGRVVLVNPAFSRLFGVRGEAADRPLLEVVRHPLLARLVEETLSSGEGRRAELEADLATRRTLSVTAALLGGGGGAVLVAKDVSDGVRLGEMRRDLVANVSHELKTPLAAIRGYAETLLEGALDDGPTARAFLERILVQCGRLLALLDDLLILSRLESPEAVAERSPVDLGRLAERAAELVADLAGRKKVTVSVQAARLPPIGGDAHALERMLLNLLENGVKYNHPGGRVTVAVRREGQEAVLEVVDTGIGIPASALGRIFERFYRVDRGRSRDEGGTGLGLAIVKHAAQIHGGSVEAESEVGRGSLFRVRLPLA